MPGWLSLTIAIASLITSVIGLVVIFVKVVRWVDKKDQLEKEVADIRLEQSLVTVGVLACLKALISEQKDNKDLKDAAALIEDHINRKAHGL